MPITRWCDERRLGIRARILLFQTVCSAVQYAHQKLIVHRDLKPSNILVTEDGKVKLLDFGIAKLLASDPSETLVTFTRDGMLLMTPEYASPEQIKRQAITTATDVYCLGVVLYELLAGRRPYRLRNRLLHEVARVICEEEPARPSTAATTEDFSDQEVSDDNPLTARQISELRESTPGKLRRCLEGDLDNILLQTLRKEPARRYGSVEGLSEDLGRYLEGRPVRARRDTIWYRTGKFVRRNESAIVVAGIVFILLVGGIIITSREATIAERRLFAAEKVLHSLLTDLPESTLHWPNADPARRRMVGEAKRLLRDLQIDAKGYPALRRDLESASQWDRQGYSDAIVGWTPQGAAPEYYRIGSDAAVSHSGRFSAFIQSKVGQPPSNGYLLQTIRADDYAGRRVRLSAFSLAERDDHAELFLSTWGVCGGLIRAVQTIKGRGGWDQYSLVVDVPENAVCLRYGIGISGYGLVRLDDVKLEIVDQATSVTPSPLPAEPCNLGLVEDGSTSAWPKSWWLDGSDLQDYKVAVNDTAACGYYPCASISSLETAVPSSRGGIMQSIQAGKYLGRTLRVRAALKTENVMGGVHLWMRIDSKRGWATAFDYMDNRAIQGTKDWSAYEVVLPVAPDSSTVSYGFFLLGSGKAFMKDVRIEIVANTLPLTNMAPPVSEEHERFLEKYCTETSRVKRERDKLSFFPKEPVNLDFEE